MVSFIEQILSILTSSPGNLVYFLVVAFTITAAFQLSINQWRRSGFPQGKRMVIGLGILLLVQIIQFTLAILAWQNLFPLSTVLPPLERAIGLLILVVAAWLWLFPEPDVIADVATFFIGLLVLVFFFITYAWWGTQPFESTYNGSWADFASVIFARVEQLAHAYPAPEWMGIWAGDEYDLFGRVCSLVLAAPVWKRLCRCNPALPNDGNPDAALFATALQCARGNCANSAAEHCEGSPPVSRRPSPG
jgi:hypothetical protein